MVYFIFTIMEAVFSKGVVEHKNANFKKIADPLAAEP
jgi:hypothetical protein